MKKFRTYLLALMAMLLFAPDASAQEMIGKVLEPSEITDGKEVVFEARSGTNSKGRYLVPFYYGQTNPAQPVESILEVPEEMVWVIEESDTPNSVTGLTQYYIKNRKTGLYLTFDWGTNNPTKYPNPDDDPDRWINLWNSSLSAFTADKESAKTFCLVSNADTQWKGQYGSNSYGSSQSDWGESTYTIVYIFDATGCTNKNADGGGYGRVYLCNEFEASKFNIRWYSQFQDTNVWDIREVIDRSKDPKAALEGLIDNYPANVDEYYLVGDDPGYVKQDVYDNFYNLYSEALSGLETMTDDQLKTTFDNLNDAKTAIDADEALVQIKDGGYYYIKTAYTAFTSVENGEFGWCAPYTGSYAGWKAIDKEDNQFIWQIKFFSDTTASNTSGRQYYSFQNMGSGKYLGKATSHSNSQPILYTDTLEERMFASNLDRGGQFNIGSKYDYFDAYPPRPYHMEGHASGAGTAGRLVLWDGGLNTASSWRICNVPQEVIDNMANHVQKDSLRAAVLKYADMTTGAEVGDALGYAKSQETIDAVTNALTKANELLATTPTPTEEEFLAARNTLEAAAAAFSKELNNIPDGYYIFHSNHCVYIKNWHDTYMALYNDTLPGWKHYNESSEFIWKVTNTADGKFTIQNVKNGMYLDAPLSANSSGSIVQMTAQPNTPQIIEYYNGAAGIFKISSADAAANKRYYDPNGHNNGQNNEGRIHIWTASGTGSGVAWFLEPVAADKVDQIVANEAQNERNIALKAAFAEGRAAYNSGAVYTTGDPIITAESQLFVNNRSTNEGKSILALIDGNKDTWLSSTWEGAAAEQTPNEPHSIRVYDEAGLPDQIVVKWLMRQHTTWHRLPSHLRVQVSNDTIDWVTLPVDYEPADFGGVAGLTALQTEPTTFVVSGVKDYKYVRFISQCNVFSNGDVYENSGTSHYFFDICEMNVYPLTGVDASGYNEQATHKGVSDELYAALVAANTEIYGKNATQATIDRLTAAIEAYNSLDSNDDAISWAKYYTTNLTAGTNIGEFPEADLNTYKTAVNAALSDIDTKGSALTPAELKADVATINDSYTALYKTMVKPQANKWYGILAQDPDQDQKILSAGGLQTNKYGNGTEYVTESEETDALSSTTLASWTINEDTTGAFVIQNAGMGGYFGPTGNTNVRLWYSPKAFTIVPLGEGQIAFRDASGYFVKGGTGTQPTYTTSTNDFNFKDTGYAWQLEATATNHDDAIETESRTYCAGRVIAFTKPYQIAALPTCEDGEIQGYELVGAVYTGEGDSIVSAYKLKKVETPIPAGKPVIYIMPGDYDEEVECTVTFTPVIDTEINYEVDTVNGLISVIADWATPKAHLGYFLADSVVDEARNTKIGTQRAVIDPSLVETTADEYDAIVYVKGAGMLNDIDPSKVIAVKTIVSVYTTDGVLVRKNVDAATATQGLAKGVYLVGDKKVIVK